MIRHDASASVQLLGVARLRVGSQWVPFVPKKRFQLLAYLAYSGDWVSRAKAAHLFWADTTTAHAQQNLRQLLHRTRSLAWLTAFEVTPHRLRWSVATDVHALQKALGHDASGLDAPDHLLALYPGPLLEGLESDEAQEFSAWPEVEREHLEARWCDALRRHARELQSRGEHGRAAELLKSLLDKNSLDEEALKAYLSAASLAGQREGVLRAYRDFSRRLHDEVGLAPGLDIERLLQAIRDGDAEGLAKSDLPSLSLSFMGALAPLPHSGTTFVGRERELAEIARLLLNPECRILTLIGPGGIGKTRLALQAMRALADRFEDGMCLVSLESLSSPELTASRIAEALGIAHGSDEPLAKITSFIGEKRMLLVLDNYEQLLEAALLLSSLVQACPKLSVLVTSRECLNLAEEWLLPIEGLPFPQGTVSAPDALVSASVDLFVQRARQVRPGFGVADADLPHLISICRFVEGSPLALELAAVWARVMAPADIAGELQENLDFLTASTRNLPARHRSMRAVFAHSWNLLTPEEQGVLQRLSVFRGGFRKEAARAVAGASLQVLAALLNKSMLRVSANGRYDRHPLLYQYAVEKLAEHPDEEARVRAGHAAYFLALAEETRPKLRSIKDTIPLNRLEQEHENLRAALDWSLGQASGDTALRLAGALGQFWEIHGYLKEGSRWLEAALAQSSEAPAAVRARALMALGRLILLQGGSQQAEPLLAAGLELWRRLGNKASMADALNQLGTVALGQHDYGRAETLYEEGLALYREVGDGEGVAILLNNFGEVARCQQDFERAAALYEESLSLLRESEDGRGIALVLGNLGSVALRQGSVVRAEELLKESLRLKHGFGDEIGLSYCFAGMAGVARDRGDLTRAVRLLATSQALLTRTGHLMDAADQADFGRVYAALHTEVGEAAFAAAWTEGLEASLERAFAYAMDEADSG